ILLMMNVRPSVERSGRVREHLVIADIVMIDFVDAGISCGSRQSGRRRVAQIAQQRQDSDVGYIVTEAPTVWPAARQRPVIEESRLKRAMQHVRGWSSRHVRPAT